MTKKLVILLTVALVLGLALAPAAFAKKPDPMPGPSVVQSFDGDVYLFADITIPAATTDPWGKISFDLWGETFKFYFKAANLTSDGNYTLKVGDRTLGTVAVSGGAGSLSDNISTDESDINGENVTLTDGITTLTSFYPISFLYIAPTP